MLAEACARHDALLAVNDRADVALAAGADVLHLGQDDLPVAWARRVVGEDVIVGRSTHSADETAAAAEEPGVDYFCVGPCWPTPTKPGRPAPGLVWSGPSRGAAPRPWFAIGGIDEARLDEVLAAGATTGRRRAGDHGGRRSRSGRRPYAVPPDRDDQPCRDAQRA